MPNDPLARARAAAKEEAAWTLEWERDCEARAVDTHFAKAGAAELIRMYETRRNLEGEKLTKFESRALVAVWYIRFGAYPKKDIGAE